MMADGFIQRRRKRHADMGVHQNSVFGLGLGFILSSLSAHRYFLVIGAWDAVWLALLALGLILLAAAVIAPHTISPLNYLVRQVGGFVGGLLLHLILLSWYLFFLTPSRLIGSRAKRPPIYRWQPEMASLRFEGWVPKEMPTRTDGGANDLLEIFAYFARKGHWVLLPGVIVLVLLGFLLFFAQTSALAPLIYTLF